MTNTKEQKLSPAQTRFLREVKTTGQSNPPWGFPSAWHRTAKSLQRKGLVNILRSPHGHRAVLA